MSNENRLRASALALLCCASGLAMAADGVQVFPKSQPLVGGKSTANAQVAAVPSPTLFEIKGKLDEHGHVQSECHEVANPKANVARNGERDRGVVKQEQQQ